jgi:hypothetical protein
MGRARVANLLPGAPRPCGSLARAADCPRVQVPTGNAATCTASHTARTRAGHIGCNVHARLVPSLALGPIKARHQTLRSQTPGRTLLISRVIRPSNAPTAAKNCKTATHVTYTYICAHIYIYTYICAAMAARVLAAPVRRFIRIPGSRGSRSYQLRAAASLSPDIGIKYPELSIASGRAVKAGCEKYHAG